MKFGKTAIITLLAVLILYVEGCTIGLGGSVTETMKVVPKSVNTFLCLDVKSLRTDSALENLYVDFAARIGKDSLEKLTGISLLDVSDMAIASASEGKWVIIKGKIDSDDVRYVFEKRGFKKDEYRGVEVWADSKGREAVAMLRDMFVLGNLDNVKVSIRLNQSGEDSMYGDEDVKAVVDRLPGGIVNLVVKKGTIGSGGASASGLALNKLALVKGTLELRGSYKFKNDETAKANLSSVESNMKMQFKVTRLDCRQESEFIAATSEIDISDFIKSDAWSRGPF